MAPLLKREDREDLRRQGLTTQEIDALESVLPSVKAWLSPLSPMKPVQNSLKKLTKALDAALNSCSEVVNGKTAEHVEALNWVISADSDLDGDGDALGALMPSLARARRAAQRALDELPPVQRHTNSISPHALRRIDGALVSSGAYRRAKPSKSLKRSSTPGSRYSEIVRICLRATGAKDPTPDRPIKAHLQWLEDRRRRDRASLDGRG